MNGPVDPRAVAVGFAIALCVTAALLWAVGVGAIVDALSRADPRILAAVGGAAAVWLAAWGLSLRTVLAVLGSTPGVLRGIAVYASAVFANNVTPFGQAGGEPFSAYLIASELDVEYETGFAAISSVDALHFVPSLTLGLLGLGYFAATVALGRRLTLVAAVVVGLAVLLPALGYLAWRHREAVESGVAGLVAPVVRRVAGVLPRVDAPGADDVRERVADFFAAIDRVATDRRSLAVAVAYSTVGWLALVGSLWLSLYALGRPVPVAVALVAIPVGDLAAAAPLPGGLGGLEALLVLVIVALTPVTPGVAAAAALLHRTATYLAPTVLGGGVAAVIATDRG